jgi:hypothetical protein
MIEAPANIDDQLKEADLQIKLKDLEDRRRWWNWLKTPPVIAALITAWVAIASLVFGWITSHIQAQVEREKFQSSMLLTILEENVPGFSPDPYNPIRVERVRVAIQSGMISDGDGRICATFIRDGCPLKVLKGS